MLTASSALRFLLLAVLMAGMLAQPMLAVACAIHDVQEAAADGSQPAEPDGSDDDCCSQSSCNNCCAQAVALRPPSAAAPAARIAEPPLPELSGDFVPLAMGVAFRPPIGT